MIELEYKRLAKSGMSELKREQKKTLMTPSALAEGRVPYKSRAPGMMSHKGKAPSPRVI